MKTITLTASKRGFTLVEILMVLLILAILSGGIAFLSSDNSSSVMANKIISEIRTMKSASIMYRRDHGMITTGTTVSELEPYMGFSVENSEVSYSFVFNENGQVFLQANLSELDDKIKQKIADLADQNLFLKPGEESASLVKAKSLLAQFNLKNVIEYFTATPAYAGNGHGYGNGGKGNAHGRGWFDDFLEDLFGDDEDDQNIGPGDDPDDDDDADGEDDFDDIDDNDDGNYEDDLDDDEDYSDYEENDPYEPPHGTPGEGTGNDQQENTDTSTGSVNSEGKYSGGDKLLIRI